MSDPRRDPTEKLPVRELAAHPDQPPGLLVLTGSLAGRLLRLDQPQLMLGRSEQAFLDSGVSREHARVECTEEGCFVHDLDSTNGTFVAGRKVVEQQLEEGDEILLGPGVALKFGYQLEAEQQEVQRRVELGARLEEALRQGQVRVLYQPIVHLGTRQVVGVEALPRWGERHPPEFLPAAVTAGLVEQLDLYVLARAHRLSPRLGSKFFVAVNLSGRQAVDAEVGDAYLEALGQDASGLVLDLPGGCATPAALDFVRQARERGAGLALQDFGVDHASLEELGQLKFNQLKLDRKFVAGCQDQREDRRICLGGIRLAESLGARSLALGIETEKQCSYLEKNDCVLGQGFYFSPPVPEDEVEPLLRQGTAGGEIAPCPAA